MAQCRSCDRDREMMRKFGISQRRYDELLNQQGGVCALCLEPPGRRALAVDHDHSCCPDKHRTCGECIRGLLCARCNTGLGQLRDRVDVLERGIAYLTLYKPAQVG